MWKWPRESFCDQSVFCQIFKACDYILLLYLVCERGEKRTHSTFVLPPSSFFLLIFKDFPDVLLFQARSYNKQMRPAILDHCSGNKWTNTSHHPEFLVGEEVGNFSAPSSSSCFLEFLIFLAGPDTHTGSHDGRYSSQHLE